MIRARIKALVRELRTPDGRSRTHIGHAAARVQIADRLTQILAEEEGEWRPTEVSVADVIRSRVCEDPCKSVLEHGCRCLETAALALSPPPPGARP